MEKKPLIKQGWLRALLFLIAFLAVNLLLGMAAGGITGAGAPGNGAAGNAKAMADVWHNGFLLVTLLISFVASVVTVYAFRRWVDRRPFASLGLSRSGFGSYAGAGFFMGLLLLGTGTLVLIATKNLLWTDLSLNARQLFLGLGLMAFISFAEELVFRGYLLHNLLQSVNKWVALGLSAMVFALFHLGNPGIGFLAFFNLFLAGLMLGINYIYTGNLWFGMLFHFSWNFFEGSVLGYPVSGLHLSGVLQQELSGNALLTGGSFGFEGSAVNGVLSMIAVAALAWVYEKKYGVKPAAGKA